MVRCMAPIHSKLRADLALALHYRFQWPVVPDDLYMAGYKSKSNVQILYDLFCKSPEGKRFHLHHRCQVNVQVVFTNHFCALQGITADIVWASVTDFVKNISFFNSMLDDPDATSMIKFGPKGLGFVIDGLCIAFRLLPSLSFEFPSPSQPELFILTGSIYKLVIKFKNDSDTPGAEIYMPDGFRDFIGSVVRLDRSTSQCFSASGSHEVFYVLRELITLLLTRLLRRTIGSTFVFLRSS